MVPTIPPGAPGAPPGPAKIRALVIEDSAYNRRAITEILESSGEVEVVGRASDGDDGLQQVFALKPDVICLDLEMPRMDGFTFLRILMSRQPTPVIVVSSQAARATVFKALEFGALDFVAKPSPLISAEILKIRDELLAKIALVRSLRLAPLRERAAARSLSGDSIQFPVLRAPAMPGAPSPLPEPPPPSPDDLRVLCLGASTGGPPAIQQILQGIETGFPGAVLVTQHMPGRFTKAFAQRLDRLLGHTVVEAEEGMPLRAGWVYITPGEFSLGVFREDGAAVVRLSAEPRRYVPSLDYMLQTAALLFDRRVMAVVLTGMGNDGIDGIAAVARGGGRVVAEARETAVVYGMPSAAVETGHVQDVLPLPRIVEASRAFLHGRTP